MSEGFGDRITVTGGAGSGIGSAAGSQDHPFAAVFPISSPNAHCAAFFCDDLTDASCAHRYPEPPKFSLESIQHSLCPVRYREYPVAPLGLQFAAQLPEECHSFLRREGGHGAIEETAVPGRILQHLLCSAVIGHVASALAGDQELLAQPVILFQQKDLRPLPGSYDRREHARGAAADHDTVICHLPSTCFS